MGMFNIYSILNGSALYSLIDCKDATITWEQDKYNPWVDHQVVKAEPHFIFNIWDYIVCVESLPDLYRVYYGDKFGEYKEFDTSEELYKWLTEREYSKVRSYILKECFFCLEYAIDGVQRFCKNVAHNKAEQRFLKGIIYE